ncbi:MAG: hypothetical protein MRY83_15270 [Flavobacteriales bacterium]|nr:hypothetical protein [Flavobacteriales bacterium]
MENPLSTQSEIVRPDYFEKEAVKNLSKYKLLNEESWQKYQTLVEMILQASKSNKKGLVCQIKLEEVLYYLNLKSSSYQNIPPYVKIDSNRMNQLIKNGISDNMFDCLNYNLHFEYLQYYYALGKLNYLNGDFVEASNCFEQVLKSTRSKDLEQIKEVRELYKTCQSLIESP